MKKVLIIESSPRKGFSAKVVKDIERQLEKKAQTEVIHLREQTIHMCKGCTLCLSHGSAHCPLKDDDAQKILAKMLDSDGVIFVTPNYALQVTGLLKNLLDRLSYVFHRPRLFGKACLPVVVQGVYGGGKIAKYINEVMSFWGMACVKGAVIAGGIVPSKPKDEKVAAKDEKKLQEALTRFTMAFNNEKPKKPTLFRVMLFRMTRASMKHFDEALPADKTYFTEKGWLTAPYYYEVRLNPLKKLVGALGDNMIKNMAKKAKKKQ